MPSRLLTSSPRRGGSRTARPHPHPPRRLLAHAGTHPLLLNHMSFQVPRGISLPSQPPSPCPRACGDPSPPLEPNVIPSPSRNLVAITAPSPCPRACRDPSPPLEPNVIPSPSRNLAAITAPLRVLAHAGTHPSSSTTCHSESLEESRCHHGPPLPVGAVREPPVPAHTPLSVSSSHAGTHPPHHSPPKHHSERSEAEPRNLVVIMDPSPCPRACGDPSPPLEPNVIPSPSRNLVAITGPPPCPRACGDPSPPLEPNVIPSPSRNLVAITGPPLRVLAHAGTHPLLLNQISFRVPRGISLPSQPPSPSPHRMRGPIPSS